MSETSILIDTVLICLPRIRLALELVNVVIEFFCKGASKTRMDCYLYHLLNFYYETQSLWNAIGDELGEFPMDIEYTIEELLNLWRKKEKFPKSLEESKEFVEKMDQQHQNKVVFVCIFTFLTKLF